MADDKLEIVFCDINADFLNACKKEARDNIHLTGYYTMSLWHGDIRKLKVRNGVYISPANSFGSMGGGIDEIYDRHMFPGVSRDVMANIAARCESGTVTMSFDHLERDSEVPKLPIGEAVITPLDKYGKKYRGCYLVTAPTMEVPMDIQGTDNPYRAFMATLKILEGYPDVKQLICPGLGTGVGNISGEEAAKQIVQALNDFHGH